jgi:hypothetical protein
MKPFRGDWDAVRALIRECFAFKVAMSDSYPPNEGWIIGQFGPDALTTIGENKYVFDSARSWTWGYDIDAMTPYVYFNDERDAVLYKLRVS